MSEQRKRSPEATIRRLPARAHYERGTIDAILDEGLVAHVGFVDDGRPLVIPMVYARDGERILLHGSPQSRVCQVLCEGGSVTVTVTLVDGLVLARSAAHHSMNYRSVVAFGTGVELTDAGEKEAAFRRIVEHVVPGRYADCRVPNAKDFETTTVIAIEVSDVSAKVRTGGPIDERPDYDTPHWAGVLPLTLAWDAPRADEHLADGIDVPNYLRGYGRGAR